MKNTLKLLTLALTAFASAGLLAVTVTYDDAAVSSQIVCGADNEVREVADEMVAEQTKYKRETRLFAQRLLDENGDETDCYSYKLLEKSKEQRQ
jgi:hypothetical protein